MLCCLSATRSLHSYLSSFHHMFRPLPLLYPLCEAVFLPLHHHIHYLQHLFLSFPTSDSAIMHSSSTSSPFFMLSRFLFLSLLSPHPFLFHSFFYRLFSAFCPFQQLFAYLSQLGVPYLPSPISPPAVSFPLRCLQQVFLFLSSVIARCPPPPPLLSSQAFFPSPLPSPAVPFPLPCLHKLFLFLTPAFNSCSISSPLSSPAVPFPLPCLHKLFLSLSPVFTSCSISSPLPSTAVPFPLP